MDEGEESRKIEKRSVKYGEERDRGEVRVMEEGVGG